MRVKMQGRLRKAVIPVAGLGTRLFPATASIPKSMLPVPDSYGFTVPLIHLIVEEAISAGVEHIGLIVDPEQRNFFESYFHAGLPNPLKATNAHDYQIIKRMQKFMCRVEFITQDAPEGFGYAVYRARSWVGGEPFLLLLGDHLFISGSGISCCQQLLQSFALKRTSLIGLTSLPAEEAPKRGTAAGEPDPRVPRRYALTRMIEKPSVDVARTELRTPGIDKTNVLCFFGCYAFTPTIMKILEDFIQLNERVNNEFQLTQAIDVLREIEGCDGYLIDGTSLDVGNAEDYVKAVDAIQDYSLRSPADTQQTQTAPETLER